MDENESNKGITVKEMEGFVRKHKFEVFLVAMFLLAGIFGMGLIWSAKWSVVFATVGAIVGVLLTQRVVKTSQAMISFLLRQDKSTQLILAGVILVLAILVSPLFFLLMGLHAGKTIHIVLMERASQGK